jgi:hypothetical protein
VLPLGPDVTSAVGGAKTSACAELVNIAAVSSSAAAFRAPAGVCLPYGAMEAALEAADKMCAFEALLLMLEDSPAEDGTLDVVCEEMMVLVRSLRPPPEVSMLISLLCPLSSPLSLLSARYPLFSLSSLHHAPSRCRARRVQGAGSQ